MNVLILWLTTQVAMINDSSRIVNIASLTYIYSTDFYVLVIEANPDIMLLLCVRRLQLLDFPHDPPPYAAFTYSSSTKSYTFEDFQRCGLPPDDPRSRILQQACVQAGTLGTQWIWNDALCMNTNTNSTLSEYYNSMGQIYHECRYWIIYLHDMPSELTNGEERGVYLSKCAWSKNIWTLPQIILCREAFFFSCDWTYIGTKSSYITQLSRTLAVDSQVLVDRDHLARLSAAKKLSWANGSHTSCVGEVAYSLLGLFGVKIPVIKGEGCKAYIRLQAEILKQTNDCSLFLWTPMDDQPYRGLFSRSPAEFSIMKDIPKLPCRIKGNLYVHSEAVRVQANFLNLGACRLLPVHCEDGPTYFVPFEASGRNTWARSPVEVLSQLQSLPGARIEDHWLKFDPMWEGEHTTAEQVGEETCQYMRMRAPSLF